MVILQIDTSDSKKVTVGLEKDGKMEELTSDSTILKSELTLPLLDKLLKKNKINLKDLDEIKVNTGPGSFTGLRVGITIANVLSYLLKKPVNGREVGELELPVYNK